MLGRIGHAARRAAAAAAAAGTAAHRHIATATTTTTTTTTTATGSEDAFVAKRRADVELLRGRGIMPYPSYVAHPHTAQLSSVRTRYEAGLAKDETRPNEPLVVHGRIVRRRDAGAKLSFWDIRDGSGRLQVVLMSAHLRSATTAAADDVDATNPTFLAETRRFFQRGDIIGTEVHGYPGKTKAGELSIFASSLKLMAPCMRPLPLEDTLKDSERRSRERYLDLIVNSSSRDVFKMRSQITSEVRRFLEQRDFLEVETPIMSTTVGGASARPFETKANAIGLDMRLRISPELYLKRLVIGGFDRVFEIGKQFRNEGIDATHNPEFTTCEFYQAYSNNDELMRMTEEMLHGIVQRVKGNSIVPVMDKRGNMVNVDFSPPYRIVDITTNLEQHLGAPLPDVNNPDSVSELVRLCEQHKVPLEAPLTPSRILDRLVGHFIEPTCQQPTFLCNHPLAMSPLAKEHPSRAGLAARFELIVAGRELVNAYSELNEPGEQRARFAQQATDRQSGDQEAQETDADYCEALEFGLPPTAGWGLGIDRLVMMLAGVSNIRDVLLFPMLRPRSLMEGNEGINETTPPLSSSTN